MTSLEQLDPRVLVEDDDGALPVRRRGHLELAPPGLALAVHRADVDDLHLIDLLDRRLDLLLARAGVDLERVRVAGRLLVRALLRDQRLDDDVGVVHDLFPCKAADFIRGLLRFANHQARILSKPSRVISSVRFFRISHALSWSTVVSVVRSMLRADFSMFSLRPLIATSTLRSMPSALNICATGLVLTPSRLIASITRTSPLWNLLSRALLRAARLAFFGRAWRQSLGRFCLAWPPPFLIGLRMPPVRALPVPFWRNILRVEPATSPRAWVCTVPCRWLAWYIVTACLSRFVLTSPPSLAGSSWKVSTFVPDWL